MFASRLSSFLAEEVRRVDISRRRPSDLKERFERLRGNALLPVGRRKNVQHLTPKQVAAGILSVVAEQPGFAGTVCISLLGLRPVGGVAASFAQSGTFGEAIESLISGGSDVGSLIQVRASASEIYTGSYCRASIEYVARDLRKVTHYVGSTAIGAQRPGAETTFNPNDSISTITVETIFAKAFFQRLLGALEYDRRMYVGRPEVEPPPEDIDEETKREERIARLGLTSSSSFLHVGVEGHVTWPREESVTSFAGYTLVLLPRTSQYAMSIHIDLVRNKLEIEDAHTVIDRFLSMLSWCDDQPAVLQYGWAGGQQPNPVPKHDMAGAVAYDWFFDRKALNSSVANKALALYRQGRNAETSFLVSYAVLSYYKILELKGGGKNGTKNWLRDNYDLAKEQKRHVPEFAEFERICGNSRPSDYLFKSCRTAVAHAEAHGVQSSDPDEFLELRRLHIAADILRVFARFFITQELGISESRFDGT